MCIPDTGSAACGLIKKWNVSMEFSTVLPADPPSYLSNEYFLIDCSDDGFQKQINAFVTSGSPWDFQFALLFWSIDNSMNSCFIKTNNSTSFFLGSSSYLVVRFPRDGSCQKSLSYSGVVFFQLCLHLNSNNLNIYNFISLSDKTHVITKSTNVCTKSAKRAIVSLDLYASWCSQQNS